MLLAICKGAAKGNRKVTLLRLTAAGGWDDDAAKFIEE